MTVLFVPRSAWFTGTPTNNNGTARPRLRVPVPTITRHYTGVAPIARASTWPAEQFMPDFQRIALAGGKSYEYNYVIPPRADGSSQVWEYAGNYQAAHSAGENDVAIGVLFAIGVANYPTNPVWEPLTDPMVDAYRWLRDVLLERSGFVLPTVAEVEHRMMPGAATICPGDAIIARASDLRKPYVTPEAPMRVFMVQAMPMPSPPPLFASADGLTAVWLSADQHAAMGSPTWEPNPIPRSEARKFTLVGDCPNGYRGIWGQDSLP